MKKLRPKIALIAIFVIILTAAIPNLLWALFGEGERPENLRPITILIVGSLSITITISIFSMLINRLVIKRIITLDDATKQVMEGKYDVQVEDTYQDELGNLVNNFNQMVQALNQNEYMNKSFARNFSHELKTPLSAIKGYAELLQSDTLSEKDKAHYTKIIMDESERLNKLSSNMLLISQLDHQVMIQKQDIFNVAELLRNVIQVQQLSWEEKHLDFKLDIDDFNIVSNKQLMYQIFENVISNAIKFSPENETIKIQLKQSNGIDFSISNKGTLTEEEQNNIFQLFYIKESSRSSKSNGIGLTLTKKMVEKLQGTIEVISSNSEVIFLIKL